MIQEFEEIRRDGKIVKENMKAKDLIAMGWKPDNIIEVRWIINGKQIYLKSGRSLLAVVVPGREYVAVIEKNINPNMPSSLYILDSDGNKRASIDNKQIFDGKPFYGEFCWFEQSAATEIGKFGVAFRRKHDDILYHVDINAKDGRIIKMNVTR